MARRPIAATAERTTTTPTIIGRASDFASVLRAFIPFVCQDIARTNLCKVYLRIRGEDLDIVASDGHTLAWWKSKVGEAHCEGEIGIGVDDARKLEKMYRRTDGNLGLDIANRMVYAGGSHTKIEKCEDAFPQWEYLVSRDSLKPWATGGVGANAGYMMRVFEAFSIVVKHRESFKKAKKRVPEAFVKIECVGGELDGMRLTSYLVPELLAFVMPVRL